MSHKSGTARFDWQVWLTLALGVALAVIAAQLIAPKEPSSLAKLGSGVLATAAGALGGACVSIFMNRGPERNALDQLLKILQTTVESRLTSPESELRDFRRPWHHYHATLIEGRAIWRYTLLPFDKGYSVGSLGTKFPLEDASPSSPKEIRRHYHVEGALRDGRLLITQTAVERGFEQPMIETFKTRGDPSVHAGLALMETWDDRDVLTPVLISREILCEAETDGSFSAEAAESLDATWKRHFGDVKQLFPSGAF